MSFYKCKVCLKPMKTSNEITNLKYGDIVVGTVHYHSCKTCAIVLKETMMNYDPQKIKEMSESISGEPNFEKINKGDYKYGTT